MRAVVYRSLGGPDVVEVAEVDRPVPGLSEIRIKVQAAVLSPTDTAGLGRGFFPAPPEGVAYGASAGMSPAWSTLSAQARTGRRESRSSRSVTACPWA